MKHKNILKRSWTILWQYRALWIFGILLALTTASATPQTNYQFSGNDYASGESDFDFDGNFDSDGEFAALMEEAFTEFQDEFEYLSGESGRQKLINIITIVVLVALTFAIIGRVLHYVSQTALIRMVNDAEETEKKYTSREGWGIGWSSTSWKMFFIDVVLFLPLIVLTLGVLALTVWPLITSGIFTGTEPANILSMVTGIGLFFLFIMIMAIVSAVLKLLRLFMRRKLVLEQVSVMTAIKQGNAIVWQNFKSIGLMWLIVLGINIVWPIAMIPAALVLLVAGGAVGGIIALITYGLSGGSILMISIFGGTTFLLMMGLPLLFLGGLKQTYLSSVWTLSYRELDQPQVEVLAAVTESE